MRCLNIAILSFAILLRIIVGFHPHSGQDDYQGPKSNTSNKNNKVGAALKYGGDYEAQRHWMEITYHLPRNEWYYHDLEYWGLDYPPLTAYVSWVFGWMAHTLGSFHDGAFADDTNNNDDIGEAVNVCQGDDEDEVCTDEVQNNDIITKRKYSRGLGVLKDLVALHTSRWGFEDSRGKLYMRFTVLLSDVLIYMSAVWVLVARLIGAQKQPSKRESREIIPASLQPRLWLLLTALSQPALILIDHGHFQYNTVSLGLALWSFHFMTITNSFFGPILGSILFTLGLNFKQMELYHAPAVFAYLLGRCFRCDKKTEQQTSISTAVIIVRFISLGATVILTFLMLWWPFALSQSGDTIQIDGILQVLKRLFPFQRGIFEGKVANIWCVLSIKPFSIRNRIPEQMLPLAALALTLVLIIPPCWMLFKVGKEKTTSDDVRLMLWGTASTSLAFFLASFQVHEKGIIIPLASISLFMLDAPNFVHFFSILATWSLWPLLVIDRLTDAYMSCLIIFLCINSMLEVNQSQLPSYDDKVDMFSGRYITRYIPTLSWIVLIALHLSELVVAPPSHLPDLFPVLWSFVGCGLFCISYIATLWAMVAQIKPKVKMGKKKKKVKAKGSIPPVLIMGLLLLSNVNTSNAFVHNNMHTTYQHALLASGDSDNIITAELLERARLPLAWEVQLAKEAKPVLNLSSRNLDDILSLADEANEYTNPVEDTDIDDIIQDAAEDWIDGHLWQATEQQLIELGVLGTNITSQDVLTAAPQLLRLPTQQVVEAATFLLSYPSSTTSTAILKADLSLLTYLADDLQYGLEEYLPNMLFMGNRSNAAQMIEMQLSIAPSMALQLLKMGVEGGLEERAVSRALGSAGTASGKAVEGVVSEMGKSYKQLNRIKGRKKSL